MRRFYLCAILVILFAFADSSLAATKVLSWQLNDNDSSSTILDSVGTNNGTLFDVNGIPGATTAAHQTVGAFGGALTFDGIDDEVTNTALTGMPFAETDQWTFNFWIKPDVTPPHLTNLIGLGNPNDFVPFTKVMASYRTDGLHFWNQNHDLSMGFALDTGVWNMITIIYDGTGAKEIKFYKNGVVGTSFPGIPAPLDPILTLAPGNVWNGANMFDGAFDEVEIFSGLLTGAEILDLFDNVPLIAKAPKPLDGSTGVQPTTILSWSSGFYADSHNVYFGNSTADVSPSATPVSFQQSNNLYDPGLLDLNETYYWRIDAVNTSTSEIWTGDIWSFEVMKSIDDIPDAWLPELLSGTDRFQFAMYGAVEPLSYFQDLVSAMQNDGLKGLGDCFDPGPPISGTWHLPKFQYLASIGMPSTGYSTPYRSVPLADDERANLAVLENAGVWASVGFGEWGYGFHIGMGGFNRPMTSREDCYNYLRAVYEQQMVDYRDGKGNSVTGHSHYECYAAEWDGTRMIGIEVGENISSTQSKVAFTRGASRQHNKPWSIQMSPWWANSVTSWEPLWADTSNNTIWRGLDAGHSLSLYQRVLKYGWFAGAALVTPENSISIVFNNGNPNDGLNSWGVEQAKTYAFMLAHDRGVPYMPVAIILDHYAGYNNFMAKAWGYFDFTAADWEIDNLFTEQLYPGSDHLHHDPYPENREKAWLVQTPYGEISDVFLSTIQADLLSTYPVILLIGDITFDAGFKSQLLASVQAGSELLMHPRHQTALGSYYTTLAASGDVEVLSVSGEAISGVKLSEIANTYLPVNISGSGIQYQVNRNVAGWVVELIHNSGVWKDPSSPAVVNPADVANVVIQPKFPVLAARRWEIDANGDAADVPIAVSSSIPVTVGPGGAVYIELIVPLAGDFQPDGEVDELDLVILAENWLETEGISNLDLNGNGRVDFADFAIIAGNWGKTKIY